ncbi:MULTISPECIES: hypothetical protein [Streptomyces]|uniref:Uncharacterized protein n=1 Tax=Streptomyces griseorubens TaxID=66897 RepID=A0ABR4SVW0_9ACTN|nr:hypothetical protein [Streptomyces lusitanus]KEG39195.1 hypothetical protein DJ64_16555 [Streptomyces griseorubens]
MVVEVGGVGTIAQSIKAAAYRGTISMVGHVTLGGDAEHASLDEVLLALTYNMTSVRAIGGGSGSDRRT